LKKKIYIHKILNKKLKTPEVFTTKVLLRLWRKAKEEVKLLNFKLEAMSKPKDDKTKEPEESVLNKLSSPNLPDILFDPTLIKKLEELENLNSLNKDFLLAFENDRKKEMQKYDQEIATIQKAVFELSENQGKINNFQEKLDKVEKLSGKLTEFAEKFENSNVGRLENKVRMLTETVIWKQPVAQNEFKSLLKILENDLKKYEAHAEEIIKNKVQELEDTMLKKIKKNQNKILINV